MPSLTTTPIAGRVPNHVAAEIRAQARLHGITVSDYVRVLVTSALGRAYDADSSAND